MTQDHTPRTRPGARSTVRCTRHYYWQEKKDRIFVTYCAEQGHELRKLCGSEIMPISQDRVNFRRTYQPFSEEIDFAESAFVQGK